jgi:hypothetical protein
MHNFCKSFYYVSSIMVTWYDRLQSCFKKIVLHEILLRIMLFSMLNHVELCVQMSIPCCHRSFNFNCIFLENSAFVKILSREIGNFHFNICQGTAWWSLKEWMWIPCCYIPFNFNPFSNRIMHQLKFYQGAHSPFCLQRNCIVEFIGTDMHSLLSHGNGSSL